MLRKVLLQIHILPSSVIHECHSGRYVPMGALPSRSAGLLSHTYSSKSGLGVISTDAAGAFSVRFFQVLAGLIEGALGIVIGLYGSAVFIDRAVALAGHVEDFTQC